MRKCGREWLPNRYGLKKGKGGIYYDTFVHEKQYCYYKNVHDGYDARIEKK